MVLKPCDKSVATVASAVDMSVTTGFALLSTAGTALILAFFGGFCLDTQRSGNEP